MRNALRNLPLHPALLAPLPTSGGVPNPRRMHLRRDPEGHGQGGSGGGSGSTGENGGSGDGGGSAGGENGGSGSTDKGEKGEKGGKGGDAGKGGEGDLGFPQNTPVVEMTLEQQVAYHKHQARKHEERASAYWQATGGKSANEVKAIVIEHGTLRQQSMSEQERAVDQAKAEGRREGSLSAARTALEFALGHDPEKNDKTSLIDTLDLSKVLTDSGEVDTAKVRTIAGQFAPADKDKGGREFDFGGGDRGNSKAESGVKAGADRYAQRRGKTAATSTT